MTGHFPEVPGIAGRPHNMHMLPAAHAKMPPLLSTVIDPCETSPCNVCTKRHDCTRFRQCKPWLAWAAVSWKSVTAPLKRGE